MKFLSNLLTKSPRSSFAFEGKRVYCRLHPSFSGWVKVSLESHEFQSNGLCLKIGTLKICSKSRPASCLALSLSLSKKTARRGSRAPHGQSSGLLLRAHPTGHPGGDCWPQRVFPSPPWTLLPALWGHDLTCFQSLHRQSLLPGIDHDGHVANELPSRIFWKTLFSYNVVFNLCVIGQGVFLRSLWLEAPVWFILKSHSENIWNFIQSRWKINADKWVITISKSS